MKLLYCLVLVVLSSCVLPVKSLAQIMLEFKTQDASCSGKGSITTTATGGKAPYAYEIVANECGLNNRPLQSNNVFSGLTSCTYSVKVYDADGKFVVKSATVGGNYVGPSASVTVDGCGFAVESKNGRAPVMYSISTDGGKKYGTPSNQNIFTGLAEGTYYIKVTDACNTFFITSATIVLDELEFNMGRITNDIQYLDSIGPINIKGSAGPFEFLIVNGSDTLRSSNTHFAIKDIHKTCSSKVIVKSACGVYIRDFTYMESEISCLDISNGNVEFKINVGVGPYTSFYYPNYGGAYSGNGLSINNMPKNDDFYAFRVIDGCGHQSANYNMSRGRPEFSFKTSSLCSNFDSTSLLIYGTYLNTSQPYQITCVSCLPAQVYTTTAVVPVTIKNLNPGIKKITIKDSCGEAWTCISEPKVFVSEACDSIVVYALNTFKCDNRPSGVSTSGSAIVVDKYYVIDSKKKIIDSNHLGVFGGLKNDTYTIEAKTRDCGTITTGYTRQINPDPSQILLAPIRHNKNCKTLYQINLDIAYEPYRIVDSIGNPVPTYPESNRYTGTSFESVPPGKYFIKSLRNCWEKTIELPVIQSKLVQDDISICPAGGSITLSGGKSSGELAQIFKAQGLTLAGVPNPADWYTLGSRSSRFNYDTAHHTYYNIEPGKTYTAYLFTMASITDQINEITCPSDSFTFTVPQYIPPSLISDLTLKCDQSNSALAQLKISHGTAPYSIQEINCTNNGIIGNPIQTEDSIATISDLSLNDHCFRVTDACFNVADIESSIGDLNSSILSQKNCDTTTTFFFSNIPGATYSWTNNSIKLEENKPLITIGDPTPGDKITLNINYKGCSSTKLLKIDSFTIEKINVSVIPDKATNLCFGDSVLLTARVRGTDNLVTYYWNTGATDSTIMVHKQGNYAVSIRSSSGCTAMDSLKINIGKALSLIDTVKNIDCFGNHSGSIHTGGSGGIMPYSYLWSDGSSKASLINKPAGSYSVTLKDFAGCITQKNFQLNQNAELDVQAVGISDASCNSAKDASAKLEVRGGLPPYTYVWNLPSTSNTGSNSNVLSNLGPGKYAVTVTDRAICSKSTSFTITAKPTSVTSKIDTICAGSSLQIGSIKHTKSGVYNDTLKNSSGCDSIIILSLVVNAPLDFDLISTDPSCFDYKDGSISITNINSKSPYKIEMDGKPDYGINIKNLIPGKFKVKITDAFGCSSEKTTALSNPKKLELDGGKDTIISFGDSLRMIAITNAKAFEIKSVAWDTDIKSICANCITTAIKPTDDVIITVRLETKNGCTIEDHFKVTLLKQFKYFAPNAMRIQPGARGAGSNSRFTIYGDKYLKSIEYLRVFDRSGGQVFEGKEFNPNDPQIGWDGTMHGKELESGVYVFLAKLTFTDGSYKTIKGDITLLD